MPPLLLDQNMVYQQVKYVLKIGLLIAYEKTGYDATVPGRLPDLLSVWSAKRIKEQGADAVKSCFTMM